MADPPRRSQSLSLTRPASGGAPVRTAHSTTPRRWGRPPSLGTVPVADGAAAGASRYQNVQRLEVASGTLAGTPSTVSLTTQDGRGPMPRSLGTAAHGADSSGLGGSPRAQSGPRVRSRSPARSQTEEPAIGPAVGAMGVPVVENVSPGAFYPPACPLGHRAVMASRRDDTTCDVCSEVIRVKGHLLRLLGVLVHSYPRTINVDLLRHVRTAEHCVWLFRSRGVSRGGPTCCGSASCHLPRGPARNCGWVDS